MIINGGCNGEKKLGESSMLCPTKAAKTYNNQAIQCVAGGNAWHVEDVLTPGRDCAGVGPLAEPC